MIMLFLPVFHLFHKSNLLTGILLSLYLLYQKSFPSLSKSVLLLSVRSIILISGGFISDALKGRVNISYLPFQNYKKDSTEGVADPEQSLHYLFLLCKLLHLFHGISVNFPVYKTGHVLHQLLLSLYF